jgi:L-ascorbate metabolism protein UlaG (beta-lactamase superfamily)
MEITWHGQSFFEIKSKDPAVKIAIDPFDETIGLRVTKPEADILLISHDHNDHSNKKVVKGNPFIIEEPGEYEVHDVYIKAIASFHNQSQGQEGGLNNIYVFQCEDIKVCHLGDFGQKELSDEQLEAIGNVDILMIPVGGVYTLDAKGASKVISQVEPRLVIPMHYQIRGLKLKLDPLDKFLKEMGFSAGTPEKKLKLKKSNLSADKTDLAVLEVS